MSEWRENKWSDALSIFLFYMQGSSCFKLMLNVLKCQRNQTSDSFYLMHAVYFTVN